jgi:hypothetical protein
MPSRALGSVGAVGLNRQLPMNVQHFSAELQAQLERLLSLYIGPLAKTLVRKEVGAPGLL